MRLQILTSLFSVLMLAACGEPHQAQYLTDGSGGSGIVGGTEVKAGDKKASSVVMIYLESDETSSSEICTGTIISKNIVLTAAHCIPNDTSTLALFFGPKPFEEVAPKMTVNSVKIHEKYHPAQKRDRNDIALIFFDGDLPKGATIASLFEYGDIPLALESYGYGRIEGSKDLADASADMGILRKVALNGADISTFDGGLLQLDQSGGKGNCLGDSGGPLFTAAGEVVGVFSGVMFDYSRPDICSFESLFTNVVSYRDWIITNAKLH